MERDRGHLRVVLEPAEPEAQGSDDGAEGAAPVDADSVRPGTELEALPQPAYGVRADRPGPRGCWALKRNGDPCGAGKRRDGDFCTAHSGLGVAKNPAEWSVIGRERSAESRRQRAALRLELGISRPSSIRGMLRAEAFVERERVVAAALAPIRAGDDLSPAARSKAALALLDAIEPQQRASLDLPLPSTPDGVDGLSLAQLRQLAETISS